jgi:hypothetical protein
MADQTKELKAGMHLCDEPGMTPANMCSDQVDLT